MRAPGRETSPTGLVREARKGETSVGEAMLMVEGHTNPRDPLRDRPRAGSEPPSSSCLPLSGSPTPLSPDLV